MKAQKHAHFHVFSPFSASFYLPLHRNGIGSIAIATAFVRQTNCVITKISALNFDL